MRGGRRAYRPYGGRRGWPVWLRALLALIVLGALAFGALLTAVLWGGRDQVEGEPGVMIILGCQVKPWGPSELLQDRLDKALDYLEDHPEVTVIVSGAQGPDEPMSEARAMYDYLTAHGVDSGRILLEDRSSNTWQNLNRSLALIRARGLEGEGVVVVSNGFHLARVRMLWDRAGGGQPLSTLAAPCSHLPSRLKMYLREPIALVKSFVLDRN